MRDHYAQIALKRIISTLNSDNNAEKQYHSNIVGGNDNYRTVLENNVAVSY